MRSLLLLLLPLSAQAMRKPTALESPGAAKAALEAQLQRLQQRLRGSPSTGAAFDKRAAPLIGTWTKASTDNMDAFLDRALGVGAFKRKLAIKAGQKQKITFKKGVVHLEMTDKRGTKKHEMHPHGRTLKGKGFSGLPCKRRVTWARDGALIMTEQYQRRQLAKKRPPPSLSPPAMGRGATPDAPQR